MARYRPLPPIETGWAMKPVDSAETGAERDHHGRSRYWIRHDVVRDVTPAMLVWWFNDMRGDVDVFGTTISRHRLWHPRDHVLHEYVRPARDGRLAGPGEEVGNFERFLPELYEREQASRGSGPRP